MTRPVFLSEDLTPSPDTVSVGTSVHLGGPEGRHAAVVRRLGVGDELDVVDGLGLRLTCTVTAVGGQGLDLRVLDVSDEGAPRPSLVLVQALAKGGRDEQAVESATEIGMDSFIPWQSERTIVRWNAQKAQRGRAKWQDVARSAAKQSRRAHLPSVHEVLDTRGLVRWVQGLVEGGGVCLVCHEEASRTLVDLLREDGQTIRRSACVAVVVGPEGGITPAELSSLETVGGRPVLLGPHVLRSSTAGPAAGILLCAALGRW